MWKLCKVCFYHWVKNLQPNEVALGTYPLPKPFFHQEYSRRCETHHVERLTRDSFRRAKSYNAVPPWVDFSAVREIYLSSHRWTENTGVRYVVDHIVPLSNDSVCGLHVPWNLQVIDEPTNTDKGHKFFEELGIFRGAPGYRAGLSGSHKDCD